MNWASTKRTMMTHTFLNRFYRRRLAYSILVAIFYLENIGCEDLEFNYDLQRESSSDTGKSHFYVLSSTLQNILRLDSFDAGCHDHTQVIDSIDRKHGSISSPNFQSNCPLDVVRRYHFKGTPEERVQLAFTEMHMEVEEQDGTRWGKL